MILSTTEIIPDREIEKILGIARGSTVRSRNVARDLVAQLKNIIGGEIEEYTKLQAYAREQALERLIVDAAIAMKSKVHNEFFFSKTLLANARRRFRK